MTRSFGCRSLWVAERGNHLETTSTVEGAGVMACDILMYMAPIRGVF